MNTRLVLSVCTAALAGIAAAQTFFRDDFNTLSPEWDISHPMENSPAELTYEINQGNLVATGVLPGYPWYQGGGSSFTRLLLPSGQYLNGLTEQVRLRARFTLPRGDVITSIGFSMRAINQFGFDNPGAIGFSLDRYTANGQFRSVLSQEGEFQITRWTLDPLPYYELDLFRQGNEMVATLNGMELNRLAYIPSGFNEISFGIGGFYGTTTVGPRVDYIEVVPEPIAVVGFGAAAARAMLRRRKKNHP